MKKVMVVLGTRPEAIKMAPVILELKKTRGVKVCVVSTGQHRIMVNQVLEAFHLKLDVDLRIMRHAQSLEQITAGIFHRFPEVLRRMKPDLVLVQGDTSTALAAALAAFYQRRAIGHVEAGLRTFRKYLPFPEEKNRVLIDHLADLHFAATPLGRRNLLREGMSPRSVTVTGNTVVDALYGVRRAPRPFQERALRRVPWDRRVVLVTMHRREHWGAPLRQVCRALRDVVRRHPDSHVIVPVHLNPRVQAIVRGALDRLPSVTLTPPLGYGDFVQAMAKSAVIVTDSGGVQEEAPYLGKPVLVFRVATERPEAVKAGTSRVIGFEERVVAREISRLLTDRRAYRRMARVTKVFGDGRAASRIVKAVMRYLSTSKKP